MRQFGEKKLIFGGAEVAEGGDGIEFERWVDFLLAGQGGDLRLEAGEVKVGGGADGAEAIDFGKREFSIDGLLEPGLEFFEEEGFFKWIAALMKVS